MLDQKLKGQNLPIKFIRELTINLNGKNNFNMQIKVKVWR